MILDTMVFSFCFKGFDWLWCLSPAPRYKPWCVSLFHSMESVTEYGQVLEVMLDSFERRTTLCCTAGEFLVQKKKIGDGIIH